CCRSWQCSSACARTRWRCRLARTAFASASDSHSVAAEHEGVVLLPTCTSSTCPAPAAPASSTMTRHCTRPLPFPQNGRASHLGDQSYPQVSDGLLKGLLVGVMAAAFGAHAPQLLKERQHSRPSRPTGAPCFRIRTTAAAIGTFSDAPD